MTRRKLLILYTEIAGYTLACLRELDPDKVEVHLVKFPVNKEAPFVFKFPEHINVYERSELDSESLAALANKINPDAILCCGWMDKDYLKIVRAFSKKAICILTMDNKWEGTFRQRLAILVAKFTLTKFFDFIWVPGELQKTFAMKLGFSENQIQTGFYSADVSFFRDQYIANKESKKANFPHVILYAGRYASFKGVDELWNAFVGAKNEFSSDWELWCLGTGDIEPMKNPSIKHFGFVQPDKMNSFIQDGGVYVLPSQKEPWAVSVHEFAAAGFPLLLSKNVGAAEAFLEEGKNGFAFDSNNVTELKNTLLRVMKLSEAELFSMGTVSADKALQITPEKWVDQLLKMISE